MVDPGDRHRLRGQDLAVRLRLGLLPKLRQRVRAAGPAVRLASRWPATRRCRGRPPPRPSATCGTTPTSTASASATTARARRGTTRTTATAARSYSDLTQLQARFGEHVDPRFPGWNLDCSDHAVREPEWEREFRAYERNGNLPGARDRVPARTTTPRGRRQARRRRRPTWPTTTSRSAGSSTPSRTAATGGARRSSSSRTTRRTGPTTSTPTDPPALVISPFTQHAGVDSTHYDTAGMLGDDRGHARARRR